MNKQNKQQLYQISALAYGYNVNATYSNSSGSPVIRESVGGLTIQDINRFNVPSMRPYGFVSMPNANTLQVVSPLGVTTNNPMVLGHLDVFDNKPFTLAPGESAVYANGMATKVGNDAVKYFYGRLSATAISGEDVNQILADIITYLQEQISLAVSTMVSTYNSHYHTTQNDGDTSSPIAQMPTPAPFPGNLIQDLADVEQGTTLITAAAGG